MHGIIIVPTHINIFIDSVVFDSFSSWRLRRTIQADSIAFGSDQHFCQIQYIHQIQTWLGDTYFLGEVTVGKV